MGFFVLFGFLFVRLGFFAFALLLFFLMDINSGAR